MMKRHMRSPGSRLATVLLAAGLALGLSACDSGTSGPSTSSLSVGLTDAEGDVEAVWVEITDLQLVGGPADAEDDEGDDEEAGDEEAGPLSLLDEPTGLVKLSDLVDETRTIVNDFEVPAGIYTQLRVIVGDAVLLTEGGDAFVKGDPALPSEVDDPDGTGALQCPSCSQTGLKVKLPDGHLELTDPDEDVILDFDVAQSFGREAGMSGMWVMHPVMTATEAAVAGEIAGTVQTGDEVTIPECGGAARSVQDFVPTATASDDAETVKSTEVAEDGSYLFDLVAPGDWSMGFEAEIGFETETLTFEADVSSETVTVQSGSQATADYTITSATCTSS